MRDAAATRRRLLDAATEEFAAHGIAGARVDRIAAAARSNKAQMYGFFGSKDGLFDAVLAEHFELIVNAAPLDGADLPGYATALYDAYLEHPRAVRLGTWSRLERHGAGGDLFADGVDHSAPKVAVIAAAQRDGHVDPGLDPADVLSLVVAMAMAWSPASVLVAAGADEPAAVHARRKAALAAAVRRAVAPAG
ncbi:TetR family transcriptional regulator [Kineococcus terrestris]|uniref:TetR family transcriptional regulator n=1 Tax=Kineococcus terrestris TaxID=2044856 RepID=UPI0034DB13B5